MSKPPRLPDGVSIRDGSYRFRKRIGEGRRIDLKLCRVEEGLAMMYERLAEVERQLQTGQPVGTMGELFVDYLASTRLAEKKPSTQHEYRRIVGKLVPVFGQMKPEQIRRSHVAQMMDRMAAAVMANRYRSVLSDVFEYAMRRGLAESNPCKGIARNRERPRNRVVSTEEINAALQVAAPAFRRLLAAQALMAKPRQADLIAMTRDQVTPDGIRFAESKTGAGNVIEWTDLLRALVREALEHSKCKHVFAQDRYPAKPWSASGVHSAMRRLKVSFTFHDLRSWAASNHARPESLGMLPRYQRERRITPVR